MPKPQTRGDRAAKLAAKERAAIERKASASVVAAAGLAPKAPTDTDTFVPMLYAASFVQKRPTATTQRIAAHRAQAAAVGPMPQSMRQAPPVATPGAGGAAGGSPGDPANYIFPTKGVGCVPKGTMLSVTGNTVPASVTLTVTPPPTAPPSQPWDASKDLASGSPAIGSDEYMKAHGFHPSTAQEVATCGAQATVHLPPADGRPRKPTSHTGQWLASPDNRLLLCATVQDKGGVRPACDALGLKAATVFWLAQTDDSFRDQLNGAWAAVVEQGLTEIDGLNAGAVEYAKDKENAANANAVVSAIKYQCEMRLRIAGKLLPKLYGDKPNTEIHIGDKNIGLVCDETTRAKLIALREKITTAPAGSLSAPATASITIPGDRISFTDAQLIEDTHGRRIGQSLE